MPKKGIFEGDLEEGELEIGQVSAYILQTVSIGSHDRIGGGLATGGGEEIFLVKAVS